MATQPYDQYNSNFSMPPGQSYTPYGGGGANPMYSNPPENMMGGGGGLYGGLWNQMNPGQRAQASAQIGSAGNPGGGIQDNAQRRQIMQQILNAGGGGGGGGAGGGGGGGGGGAGGGGSSLGGNLDYMSQYSQGLMDPNSDYYKRLSSAMQEQIGGQSAAQQRASALRGAQSGFGAGAGGAQMATSADIGQAGLEAQGQSAAGLALQAPAMGMQGLQSTFSPYLGIEQMGEQSRQFGANLGENQRQFGVQTGLSQQQMAHQQALQQAQMQMQQQQMQQEALMNQYAMMYGMF